MKQFLGFTPDQASKMLQQKGLKANTREGAEYLAGMHKRAQDMLGGTGYANGGDVDDLMRDNQVKRKILAERVKANVDFQGDRQTYELIEKLPFLGRIAEDHYLKLLANSVDEQIGRQADMPFSTRLMFAGKDAKADNELYKELLSYADKEMPQGTQEPTGETPLYQKRMQEDVDRKNKMLMDKSLREGFERGLAEQLRKREEEAKRLYERSQEQIEKDRLREFQEFNERRRREYLERQGKPEFQEGGLTASQRQSGRPLPDDLPILSTTPNPAAASFISDPAPPTNVVNPFPTTGATLQGNTARDTARTNLNNAQAKLAEEQQKEASLYQELSNLPTDATRAEKEKKILEKIEAQQIKITQAQAAVSSASGAFQVAAVPTAAEAVGTAVSTPSDVVTRQQVDLIPSDDVSIADQLIATGTGKVDDRTDKTATEAETSTVGDLTQPTTVTKTASDVAQDIRDETLKTTTGTLSPDAEAKAQTIKQDELAIRDEEAATDTNNVQVVSPAKRKLEQGELISGVANAEVAKNFLEGVEAATGAPSSQATVQGQLTGLMQQFEGGNPPPWAAGAMRQATAIMAQRGLAASSMAGQAIVQAAMESALPIAMQDAKTVASFEAQNLSNRQQRAMLAAQQRAQFLGMEFDQGFQARVRNAATISDIANRNFTSEVQIALENAQLAQTTDLTVLGNKQALVMAKAAAIQQADMANLNNRQQAEVRNADAFLQMDMANFNAEQQVDMFANQSIIQGLFTDVAAENAMKQFNATSENQANQFFLKLETQVDEFNASQKNAMEQFNAGEENALTKFQEELNNQRDLFNARNELVIAQANAQWRQQLTTINNAAQNEANRQDALQANALTQKGLDEIWQRERDLMAYAFTSAENAEQRRVELMKAEIDRTSDVDSAWSTALGQFGGAIVNGLFGTGYIASKITGIPPSS